MRYLVLILIFSASLFSLETNKMQVLGTGQKVENEFVDKKKLDSNMELCAGLQIMTDLIGLSFESDNGIVSVESNPGFYILNLSAEERKVRVLCSGYEPLDIILQNYDIRLEQGRFYKIKVTGDKPPVASTNVTVVRPILRKGQVITAFEKAFFETIWKEHARPDSTSSLDDYYCDTNENFINKSVLPESDGYIHSYEFSMYRTYLNDYGLAIGDIDLDGFNDAVVSYTIIPADGGTSYGCYYAVFINNGLELVYKCSFDYEGHHTLETIERIKEITDGQIRGEIISNRMEKVQAGEVVGGFRIKYYNGKIKKTINQDPPG